LHYHSINVHIDKLPFTGLKDEIKSKTCTVRELNTNGDVTLKITIPSNSTYYQQ